MERGKQRGTTSAFMVDIGGLEERTWRGKGADIADYCNYGMNEHTWKAGAGRGGGCSGGGGGVLVVTRRVAHTCASKK